MNKHRQRAVLAFKVAAVLGFATVALAGVAVGTGWGWFDVVGPILVGAFLLTFLAMVVFWVLSLLHREPAASSKAEWQAPPDIRPAP